MKRSAYTLVELLLVIGIISTLASLLLAAVLKAKQYARHKTFQITAYSAISHTEQELGQYYLNQTNFPAFTAEQLGQKGVFDLHTMEFLRNPEVTFYPFSSTDADNKIILRVIVRSNEIPILLKTNAMHPPDE